MKPLQHAQISAKTYGGKWQDYIEIHNFLDSSKAACAHFKHRFLLHHREGIELGVRIFGETLANSENKTIETRRLLTDHLIEDVGRVVTIEDWARDLLPDLSSSFYKFLAKKRASIEADQIPGENELLDSFNLSEKDRAAIKSFLAFPLENSAHAGALLISHNSFAVYLAEQVLGCAFVKASEKSGGEKSNDKHLVAVREIFERINFQRMKMIYSPAEIIARTASREWMRGADASKARAEKKRLAML
jgi:hypothetical protein